MDSRSPIKLTPSLHRSLLVAQHAEYLSTGKKPTLGALLEAAWEKANIQSTGNDDVRPKTSDSLPTLRKLRSVLAMALTLLDGVIDGPNHADATIGEIERAIATGEDLGGRGQDPKATRITKP
jgi:hypothetical protein